MPSLLSTIWRTVLAAVTLSSTSSANAQSGKPSDSAPSSEQVFGGTLSPEADSFLTASNLEFNAKQAALHSEWLVSQKRYDIDMEKGVLRIQRATSTVEFDVQLAGSHSRRDKTWEWGWNNPNVPAALSAASAKARKLGEQYSLRYATSGLVPIASAQLPWFLSSLALKAGEGVGVFIAPSGDIDYYFVLFRPRTTEP